MLAVTASSNKLARGARLAPASFRRVRARSATAFGCKTQALCRRSVTRYYAVLKGDSMPRRGPRLSRMIASARKYSHESALKTAAVAKPSGGRACT